MNSGWTFSAWLAGMVHGVVVQITIEAGFASDARPKAAASLASSTTGKATSMVCDFLSAYSTSASARAEPQSKHQLTGLRPLNTKPCLTISASARISPASLAKFMVLYGLSQSPSTPRRMNSVFCPSICSAA
ncbi:hypothetical protein D3C78_993780 [compost metagenome]